MFTVEAQFNPQNDRVLARHLKNISEDKLTAYRRQKPASVMVWAAVSKTWKSPLIFVKKSANVNTNAYIDDILTLALREMKKHFKNKEFLSNRTALPLTPPTEPKNGAETIPPVLEQGIVASLISDLNPMDFSV